MGSKLESVGSEDLKELDHEVAFFSNGFVTSKGPCESFVFFRSLIITTNREPNYVIFMALPYFPNVTNTLPSPVA
jgi:hypothetical protein